MQATNHPKNNFPRRQFPGGYCQGAIIFGVIVREQSSRRQLSGGNYPGGNFHRGELSGGQSSRGKLSGGPGGSFTRGQLSGHIFRHDLTLIFKCLTTFLFYCSTIQKFAFTCIVVLIMCINYKRLHLNIFVDFRKQSQIFKTHLDTRG